MFINDKNVVVPKELKLPGAHLDDAKYREVIERQFIDEETPFSSILRLCVSNEVEMRKCQVMKDVAFSRDVRPQFKCLLMDYEKCSQALKNNEADVIVVTHRNIDKRDLSDLKPILFESYDDDAKSVIVVDPDTTTSDLKKLSLWVKYHSSNNLIFIK
jgi:hypothetical protein